MKEEYPPGEWFWFCVNCGRPLKSGTGPCRECGEATQDGEWVDPSVLVIGDERED